MEELLETALDAALTSGIVAADARIVAPARAEFLSVRDGVPTALTSTTGSGLGVRVRTARAWGFATIGKLTPAAARGAARTATKLARAAGRTAREPLLLTEEVGPTAGRYASSFRLDPFELPREEKLALLTEAERGLHVHRAVKSGEASFRAWTEKKWFRSSEGSAYTSEITHVGAGVTATAIRGSEVQRRSAPTSFGGDFGQAGWEFVRALDLVARAAVVGKEAVALLDAP
ncbi:MAG: TldD/PmbA family protein, partial [Thermoplasmata archaeon]|nr:TldD/PmbA family protein [Thermoplasmata archaeon]